MKMEFGSSFSCIRSRPKWADRCVRALAGLPRSFKQGSIHKKCTFCVSTRFAAGARLDLMLCSESNAAKSAGSKRPASCKSLTSCLRDDSCVFKLMKTIFGLERVTSVLSFEKDIRIRARDDAGHEGAGIIGSCRRPKKAEMPNVEFELVELRNRGWQPTSWCGLRLLKPLL